MLLKIIKNTIILDYNLLRKKSSSIVKYSIQEKLNHLEASLKILINLKSTIGYKSFFLSRFYFEKKFPFVNLIRAKNIKNNHLIFYQYEEKANVIQQRLKPYFSYINDNPSNIDYPDISNEELKFYNLLVAFQGVNEVNLYSSEYLKAQTQRILSKNYRKEAISHFQTAQKLESNIDKQLNSIFDYIETTDEIKTEVILIKYIRVIESQIEY